MQKKLIYGEAAVVVGVLLLLGGWDGCFPPGDDDDGTPEATPEATPEDTPEWETPTPLPPQVTISGVVQAVDRTTGNELTPEEYSARSGAIVVYALPDPADLVHPYAKATLVGPGYYEMEIPEGTGTVYVLAVADWDLNSVVSSSDASREAMMSPVSVGLDAIADVDIVIDLTEHGGSSQPNAWADFSGSIFYEGENAEDTNVAVVAFRGDYGDYLWAMTSRVGPGDYFLSVGSYAETGSLVAYADADRNGLYEPSDPAAVSEGNPFVLGSVVREGIDFLIEGVGPGGLPQPVPYISVTGTVLGGESYAGTPIAVRLSGADGTVTYSEISLPEPGAFSLSVPGNLNDLWLMASTDSNGDGAFDSSTDASASYGPFNVGSGNEGGYSLTLTGGMAAPTGIAGTIYYDGSFSENDRLVLAVFDSPDLDAGPVWMNDQPIATFPVTYEVTAFGELLEAAAQTSSTYYFGVVLDAGSDFSGGPGEGDLVGYYSTTGTDPSGITIEKGTLLDGIDVVIIAQ